MKTNIRKRYTAEFKAQAVELAKLGKPVPQLAEELGIGTSLIYRWVTQLAQDTQLGSEGSRATGERAEADELRVLRRELVTLKLENDILKKAAVILGTQTRSGSVR